MQSSFVVGRRAQTSVVLLALVLSAALLGLATPARAGVGVTIKITSDSLGGDTPLLDIPGVPTPAATVFSTNKTALETLADEDIRTLVVPSLTGFDDITIQVNLAGEAGGIVFDDDSRSVAFPGTFSLNGSDVDLLLLIQWFDDGSVAPNVSIGIRAGDIDLSDIGPDWTLPVGAPAPQFVDTWVVLATGEQDVAPFSEVTLPITSIVPFYPEGFAVDGPGVSYEGSVVLESLLGPLATEALGYTPAEVVNLTGDLGSTWEILNGDFDGTDLSLSAVVPPATGAALGGWLQASDDWTVTVDYTVGAPPVEVGLTGQLEPTGEMAGQFPAFDVIGTFTYDASVVNVELDGAFVDDQCTDPAFAAGVAACWKDALGHGWLDLTDVSLGLEFALVGASAESTITMHADFDPDGSSEPVAPFDMTAAFSYESGTPDVITAAFTVAGSLDMADVAALFGATGLVATIGDQPTLELTQVAFSASTDIGESTTFTVSAAASVLDAVDVDVLVTRTKTDGDDPVLLVAVRATSDVSLADFFGAVVPDLAGTVLGELSMPELTFTLPYGVAAPFTVPEANLSAIATEFYGLSGVGLDISSGVSMSGVLDLSVLGSEFLDAFGLTVESAEIPFTGSLGPIFDFGTNLEFSFTEIDLTASLPDPDPALPDWLASRLISIEDIELHFGLDAGEYFGEFTSLITANIDDVGAYEEIDVTATLSYDGGFSFEVEGVIGTWPQPFGMDLTVLNATTSFTYIADPFEVVATISGQFPVGGQLLQATITPMLVDDILSADFSIELFDDGVPGVGLPLSDLVDLVVDALGGSYTLPDELEDLILESGTILIHVGDGAPRLSVVATTTYDGVQADLLFAVDSDLEFAAALRLLPVPGSEYTFGDLVPSLASPVAEFGLPDLTLVLTSAEVDVPSVDLDESIFDFFKEVHGCEAGDDQATCEFDLQLGEGASILAKVPVPTEFSDVTDALWIEDTPVLIKGFVPIFGSTAEPRLEAVLPPITPPAGAAPEWFVSGQLSFYVSPSAFGIEGAMTVAMDGEHLTFVIGGEFDAGPPVALVLSGALETEQPWVSPFGVEWLTINGLRIELGVGPEMTVGFRGDIVIGGKDLDVSVLVDLTGGVPVLIGVRGASVEGFTLTDLATFQIQVANAGFGSPIDLNALAAGLPNMALKSAEFSYSTQSRPELCLEPGIIVGGDLYINPLGTAVGGPVGDGAGGCEQIPPRPSPSTYCIDHRFEGCFASMRVEVSEDGIVGFASLPGFSIGSPPMLQIGDAGIELRIDQAGQRLELSGMATIPGVTSGDLTMSVTRTGRAFEGDFKIFGVFYAYVDATMTTLDPLAPFNFDEASFHVEAQMRSDFSSAISAAVEPLMAEIQRIFSVVNPLWTSVTTINSTNALGVIASVPGQLNAVGLAAPQFLTDMAGVVGTIQGLIDTATDLFEEIPGFDLDSLGLPVTPLDFANVALNGFQIPVSFPGVSIPYIPETCITTWSGGSCYSIPPTPNVYATVCAPWPFDDECATILVFPALPGVPGVVVPPICLGVDVGGTCYLAGLVPVTLPGIPGLCDVIPGAVIGLGRSWVGSGTPECNVQTLVAGSVQPLVSGLLGDTIGIPAIPPLPTALANLSSVLADPGALFSLDCAAFSADLGGPGGLQSNKVVSLDVAVTALGNPFGLSTTFDFNDPAGSAFTLFKNLLTGVIFGNPQNSPCAGFAPGQVIQPPRNLVMTGATTVAENGSSTINGTFVSDDAGAHTVTIDWKDGPSQTVTLGAGVRAFSVTHQYRDDNPSGTSADTYRVTVKVDSPSTGAVSATRPIRVDNVAPALTLLTATGSVTENGVVTVNGSFSDPGSLDTHRVVVTWGEGVSTVITLDAGLRSFSTTHRYLDDNPTGNAANNYIIGVSVTDDDTGTTSATRVTTITNDVPHNLVVNYFETTSIDPVASTPGRVIDEGQWITVVGAFDDLGSQDSHVVVVDWKDGPATTLYLPVGSRGFEARHRYMDDNPTATIQDFYDVVVTVTDDDTGTTSDTQRVTVNNVTPFDVTLSFGLLAVDENEVITVNGSFVDPGLEDVHVVRINWGDGTAPDQVTLPVGGREFFFEHQYLDDDPTATPLDSYTLSVLFYDDDDTITRPVDPLDMTTKFKLLALDGLSRPIPVPGTDPEEFETIEIIRTGAEGPPIASVRNVPQEVDFVITGDLSIDQGDTVMAHILENGSISLEGWFTDPGTLDSHDVCIDWGDARTFGGPVVPAPTNYATCINDEGSHWVTHIEILADPLRPFDAPRLFSASHQYLDDNPTATETDVYQVTVWTRDDDTGEGTANHSVRVDNVTPELVFDLTPKDVELDGIWDGLPREAENEVITLTGSFFDEGTRDAWTLVIDWGDDTSESIDTIEMTLGEVTAQPGDGALVSASVEDVIVGGEVIGVEWSFVVTHQYIDDNPTISVFDIYTVTATVTDDDTEFDTKSDDVRIDNVLPTIDAGTDHFVFEDDLMSLNAAVFGDRGTADTHMSSIDWGDYSEVDVVTVTEFDGAIGDAAGADGTLDASHRYAEPGVYRASVCIVDDDEPRNPVCDTFVVTVFNSFFKFAGFGNAYKVETDRNVDVIGSLGGNDDVKIDADNTVSGDVVSVHGDVEVGYRSEIGGRIVSGHDVDVKKDAAVAGTVDADRYVEVDATASTGTVTIGPIAYDFPAIRWVDLGFVGGTNDLKTTGTTQLPPGTYGDVEVRKGTLVLGPGVYRFDSLKTRKDTSIEVRLNDGETIVVEVVGDLTLYRDSDLRVIGTAGPSDVLFLVADGKVDLGEGGSYVGTFISDGAAVKIGRGATLTGALYGRSVKISEGVRLTADPAMQLFVDHRFTFTPQDGDEHRVDAGRDQFVFEDTLVVLDPALFYNRDEAIDHSATIDWGDGTPLDMTTVTPVTAAYNEPDGTIDGSHVYLEPGEYVVSVCVFSDTEPACQLDTIVVTVVPGFLNFAGFADYNHIHIEKDAAVTGSVGANRDAHLDAGASVSGDVISVDRDVHLHDRVSVGDDVLAGRDADIDKNVTVGGDLDVGRRLKGMAQVGGATTVGTTAAVYPPVRWLDIQFSGGEFDLKTTGTTALDPTIYGDVRVDSGTLVLQAGVYRFRSLKADADTVIEIHLNTGESIVLQVEREVDFDKGVQMVIVGSGSPDAVLVLVGESKVDLGDDGSYLGTFIADDGEAKLGKSATLTGALYGRTVRIEEGATLIADPASVLLAEQGLANQYGSHREDSERRGGR
jgi:predicted acyltransferase (DUF342 family)